MAQTATAFVKGDAPQGGILRISQLYIINDKRGGHLRGVVRNLHSQGQLQPVHSH
jgi:hypothetical protein